MGVEWELVLMDLRLNTLDFLKPETGSLEKRCFIRSRRLINYLSFLIWNETSPKSELPYIWAMIIEKVSPSIPPGNQVQDKKCSVCCCWFQHRLTVSLALSLEISLSDSWELPSAHWWLSRANASLNKNVDSPSDKIFHQNQSLTLLRQVNNYSSCSVCEVFYQSNQDIFSRIHFEWGNCLLAGSLASGTLKNTSSCLGGWLGPDTV